MIASARDLLVLTEADFERLPDEGSWEVVNGRAIFSPGADIPHQEISIVLFEAFRRQLKKLGSGWVFPTVNVFVPPPEDAIGEIQNRVPDLIVATHVPKKRFHPDQPPELVIEILSTPRGNVERTEKIDDYARGGILEYWIVDPFARAIEVYTLRGAKYELKQKARKGSLRPEAFPRVTIDVDEVWAVLK